MLFTTFECLIDTKFNAIQHLETRNSNLMPFTAFRDLVNFKFVAMCNIWGF